MAITRRGVLIGSLVGGGLMVGYLLRPRAWPLPLDPGENEEAFDAWIKIAADGVVTVAVPQLEMGQGVTTLIPQVVAQELGADWRQIAVEPAPISAWYANAPLASRWADLWMPFWPALAQGPDAFIAERWAQNTRFNATAEGTALAAYELPARSAAAAVRAMLAMAAADRWDVAWEECEVANGVVRHGRNQIGFGPIAAEAAAYSPPSPPPLRPEPPRERPADFPPGGRVDFPRLDLPSKVDGSQVFAGDVRLPDMAYASIRHGPIGDSRLGSHDVGAARGVQGFLGVVKNERWIAAVARDWWAAERALTLIVPQFVARARADSERIDSALEWALRHGRATALAESGDPEAAAKPPFALTARYEIAPAVHATLETASATARLTDGKLELWVAVQAPEQARHAVAKALDMPLADIVIYPMPAGGSFDRRLEHGHAVEAALIARQAGRPVQLVWSRWQEHVAGWPRTPVSAVLAAKLGSGGQPSAWKTRIACPPGAREFGARLFGGMSAGEAIDASEGQFDAIAIDGAVPPYAVGDLVVEHVPARVSLPTARMRGNAHGYTAFFTESFIDELAHKARAEPLSYRMALLGGDLRLATCLQRVSALANWNGGVEGSAQGLACHRIGDLASGGRIAVVATARQGDTGVRVEKLTAVADIGRIVNTDIARQQIEGGMVFAVGLTLGASLSYTDGLPSSGRLSALGLPLLADCPEIEVEFVDSKAPAVDPGELSVAAVAPAIANALFSATGVRFRRLPLLSQDV